MGKNEFIEQSNAQTVIKEHDKSTEKMELGNSYVNKKGGCFWGITFQEAFKCDKCGEGCGVRR